jgi:hypothetical protein
MTDDRTTLQAAWMSEAGQTDTPLRDTVARVIEKDAADRRRERQVGIGGIAAMLVLVPFVLWASVYGVTPLIRAAYALMGAGCVAGIAAHWLYLEWARRALPGPSDTRSQLQKIAFMLECQVWLARAGAVWSSPVFIGIVLICIWLFRERSAAGALALFALDIVAWIGCGVFAARAASSLGERRQRLEDVLSDL